MTSVDVPHATAVAPAPPSAARAVWSPRLAYPVVGVVGFVIFLLEISAGRLLAPLIGVSLETWTGIITVVLAGYALGDLAGGRIADRAPSSRSAAAVIAGAGAAVMAAVPLARILTGFWPAAPVVARVLPIAGIVLLLPSILLAAAIVMATRLALRATDETGRTAGGLSAVATAGSVLGVIVGGFFLLERFGVRGILLGAGAAVAALAALPLLAATPEAPGTAPADARARPGERHPPGALLAAAAFGGGGIMLVELAATRIIAPLFGNSLYTWTSVIGVTLLGISAGNALGGRLADRDPSVRLLAAALAMAGVGTLAVLLLPFLYSRVWPQATAAVLAALPASISLPLLIGGMLLPPAAAFGTISPIVIRLLVQTVGTAGGLVGRVYAAQALGSIAGTATAGFLLISWLGARAVILLVAQSAVVAGVLAAGSSGAPVRPTLRGAAVGGLVVSLAAAVAGWVPSPCLRESNYYCIRVLDAGEGRVALALDGLIHNYVNLRDPTALGYDHEMGWAALVADLQATRWRPGTAPRALFIGGGAYVFPRYLQHVQPQSRIDVVEIDPAVTAVAYAALGLAPELPVRTWNEDGRQFFLRRSRRTYDLVFLDVFRDAYSIPAHLTTVEFARLVGGVLDPDGVYAVNIVDGRPALFVRSYVRTLREVFPYVYLLPAGREWRQNVQTIFVVMASRQPLNLNRLMSRRPAGVGGTLSLVPLSEAEVRRFLAGGPAVVLTDDRAPVDHFLARVYAATVRER